ncbi:MAG: spore protease YyaC [Anaerostipes sp.]|jgi:putative sporulation protein YyaC
MNHKVDYYNPNEINSMELFQKKLLYYIQMKKKDNQPIIILCIGTDHATGDCLGPLVGKKLKHLQHNYPVFGCLCHPIHAKNLTKTICEIYASYEDPFIIAIDACLGIEEHIGFITLSSNPLRPGESVSKELSSIGHISITGIVNTFSDWNIETIQTTSLNQVDILASYISTGLSKIL